MRITQTANVSLVKSGTYRLDHQKLDHQQQNNKGIVMIKSSPLQAETKLPLPGPVALRQSGMLIEHIKTSIRKQGGMIGFDEYMNMALYEPGLGYYSAGSRKFGPEGDFVTAPELSSLFSQCLANQCAQILDIIGAGAILELGAGTGIMARDLLLALEKQNTLPEQYFILEVSADLKQRQQALINEALPHYIDRVVWLDALPAAGVSGIILANEVLDALPVKRFRKTADGYRELKVGFDDNDFIWVETVADSSLTEELRRLEDTLSVLLPAGFISEINIRLGSWLRALERTLARGVMLFIDYGDCAAEYYHPKKTAGSLLCHYRHRVHDDPFFYAGLQDITSSVNFTAVAECADSIGLHVSGYTNQTYFLCACGLESLLAKVHADDIKTQTKIAQQVRTLTMPEAMGERFKVMALTKKYDYAPQGFTLMDQRVRL